MSKIVELIQNAQGTAKGGYLKTAYDNYSKGLWHISQVRVLVQKGLITEDEFTEVTKEAYSV